MTGSGECLHTGWSDIPSNRVQPEYAVDEQRTNQTRFLTSSSIVRLEHVKQEDCVS